MIDEKERIIEANIIGKDIEKLTPEEFIDEYLVGEQFEIYIKDDNLFIDFITGVNYYGEIDTSLEIHPDDTFRVEHYGHSVGVFRCEGLFENLNETLYDMIEVRS